MPCFKMSGIFLPAGTVTVMDCRAAPLSLEAAADPDVTCGWLCPGVTAVEPTLALVWGLGAVLGVIWGCSSWAQRAAEPIAIPKLIRPILSFMGGAAFFCRRRCDIRTVRWCEIPLEHC